MNKPPSKFPIWGTLGKKEERSELLIKETIERNEISF
jgi:hypothetical protein